MRIWVMDIDVAWLSRNAFMRSCTASMSMPVRDAICASVMPWAA